MKKLVTLSAVAFLSTSIYANTDMQAQIDALKAQLESLQKQYSKQITNLETKQAQTEQAQEKITEKVSNVNKLAAQDNLKFDVDFRTSYDNISYKMADGTTKYKNDGLYSNRLWLNMGYDAGDNMIFKGQLAFNKAFGANYTGTAAQRGNGFDTFDWIINENLTDDTIKLREAYWLWTPTLNDRGYTFSVGRRPATNGFLVNLRDDDQAKSPMGHIINMEFDGASASVKTDDISPGSYLKLCLGRGLTNADGRYGNNIGADYADESNTLDNMDMVGLMSKLYDNGQYSAMAVYYRGFNVLGYKYDGSGDLQSYGDMDGAALSIKVDGIGEEINDFLDETTIFASYGWSQTRPDGKGSMLGSNDKESGTSYWIGTQMPNMTGGRFGLEYNHGSKYWRPFTYGEDTLIGSKLAARGDAYEAYWTQPLLGDKFSMQVRYTYIKYDYTGSNGFFGAGGTPIAVDAATLTATPGYSAAGTVEKAEDLRVYFRYRY